MHMTDVLTDQPYLQGLTDPPGVAQADVPGLQLALAVIISLYIFRDKKRLGLGQLTILFSLCFAYN